jgi:hypothetical protein
MLFQDLEYDYRGRNWLKLHVFSQQGYDFLEVNISDTCSRQANEIHFEVAGVLSKKNELLLVFYGCSRFFLITFLQHY